MLYHLLRYIEIFRSSSSECRRSTIFNSNGGGRSNNGVSFNNDRMGRGQRTNRTNFRGDTYFHPPTTNVTNNFLFLDRPYPDTPWTPSNNNSNNSNDAPWRNNNRGGSNNNFGGGNNNSNNFNDNFDGGNNMFNNDNNFSSGLLQSFESIVFLIKFSILSQILSAIGIRVAVTLITASAVVVVAAATAVVAEAIPRIICRHLIVTLAGSTTTATTQIIVAVEMEIQILETIDS